MKLLSIVFSFRNEEGNIEPLIKRISTTMKKIENPLFWVNQIEEDTLKQSIN